MIRDIKQVNLGQSIFSANKANKIHFIGIGGVGMIGLAEILHNEGYLVSGSDLKNSKSLVRLASLGVSVDIGHSANNVLGVDVVVVSSAVASDNIEVVTARSLQIPVILRAEVLAELMRCRHGVAVAGTHGKTTITSLISSVYTEANRDPTYVIGGSLNSSGVNSKLGESNYLIAEADESDASFLCLQPMVSVVSNIDSDHLVNYDNCFKNLKNAFVKFNHNLPFYGLAVLCVDDPVINSILGDINRRYITYGFSEKADVRAINFRQVDSKVYFTALYQDIGFDVELNLPGKHNCVNALAVIAVALQDNINQQSILRAFKSFKGIARRFQFLGDFTVDNKRFSLVDDYGHHPNELLATINAAREGWPDKNLIMVFQPHRHSRTHQMYDLFLEVFAQLDSLILLDIYAAGESSIDGVSSKKMIQDLHNKGFTNSFYATGNQQVYDILLDTVLNDSIVLNQGAGTINQTSAFIINLLSERELDYA